MKFLVINQKLFTVKAENGSRLYLPHYNSHTPSASATYRARITAGDTVAPINRLILTVEIAGRPTVGCIPLTLLG